MKRTYIIRLDDACEKRNIRNWDRMECLLDKYSVLPIVGIIPNCEDPDMEKYDTDSCFWERARSWEDKNWTIALHGYSHVFVSQEGGLNPVNKYSEFAGVSLEQQKQKIKMGLQTLSAHGISPKIFFAPAHTFDDNTLRALLECSDIRIISDTIANSVYTDSKGFTYIPQQAGAVRNLPFRTVTFCYHPNTMIDADFERLEQFIAQNRKAFSNPIPTNVRHKRNIYDNLLKWLYFARR